MKATAIGICKYILHAVILPSKAIALANIKIFSLDRLTDKIQGSQ